MTHTDAPSAGMRLPDGFFSQHCDVSGRRLRYAEAGGGSPLLVLHGGSGFERNLSELHSRLATQWRVVAPELPGFGLTDGDDIHSLRELAGVMAEFCEALGIKRCPVLGTSLGGAVALWLAIDHPDLVELMVLEAPAAFREGAPPPGPPSGAKGPGPDPKQLAFIRRIMEPPNTDPELVAALPACQAPALVMFGQDDPMFGTRYAADYKRLPRCTVSIVYQATHDIKGSRPEAYIALVDDFLSRGPGFVVTETSTLIHT